MSSGVQRACNKKSFKTDSHLTMINIAHELVGSSELSTRSYREKGREIETSRLELEWTNHGNIDQNTKLELGKEQLTTRTNAHTEVHENMLNVLNVEDEDALVNCFSLIYLYYYYWCYIVAKSPWWKAIFLDFFKLTLIKESEISIYSQTRKTVYT